MSHHLDSPLARQDPRLDISDVYLFRGDRGTVFVMNVNPLSGTGGFHPEGRYEFSVDTDGDVLEDITFRVTFGPPGPDGAQRWELRRLDGVQAADETVPGRLLAAGITEEPADADGLRVFAGRAGDPFYIDGTVVGAVCTAVVTGSPLRLNGHDRVNLFAGTNVGTIVLEVPDAMLGVPEIGFWGRTMLATDAGGWRPINRCAQPLVNTIFHPDDSDLASDYNTTEPLEDPKLYGDRIARLTAAVTGAMGTADDPDAHGAAVRADLLPDVLRYRIGTPAKFDRGDRNGRGLTECAPEVMFELVLNTPVPLGLDHTAATGTLRETFPYLAPPVG